jgi:hypothetical protein
MRIERIDRIGLELGAKGKWQYPVEEDDPLSAVAELQRTQTMSRDAWQIRIETQMRLSCTRDVPAGGEPARVRRRAGSLPSRLGSRIARDFL